MVTLGDELKGVVLMRKLGGKNVHHGRGNSQQGKDSFMAIAGKTGGGKKALNLILNLGRLKT